MFRRIAYLLFSFIVLHAVACSQTDSLSVSDSLFAKSTSPWTVRSFSNDEISRFPSRGIENYLPLLSGVVQVNNEFHLRGSRSNETGYFIDGIDVTNPMFGSNGVPLIPEAMEQLEVHTGSYGASMGSYNGGIVMSRMKTGREGLIITANVQSDKLRSPGRRFANTTVQGYENVVGTLSGGFPLFEMRFFLAGQKTTYVNRQSMFLEPFRYDNLVDDGFWRSSNAGRPLPGPVSFGRNWIPGNRSERSIVQGNASAVVAGISLSAIGSYEESEFPIGSEWPLALTNYFNQSRNMISRTKTEFGAVRASYAYGNLLSATVTYSFYDRFSKTFDPVFKDQWMLYADSAANARYFDTSQWLNRYGGPDPFSTIYVFRFNAPGAPNNAYSKNRQSQSRWTIDVVSHAFPFVEIKAGGRIDSWTMRSFSVTNIRNLLSFLDGYYPSFDGIVSAVFASDYEKRVRYLERGGISNYGYTFLGKASDGIKLNGGPNTLLDPPYRPRFASAYVEGSIESDDVHVQGGVRYEYFNPKFITVPDPLATATSSAGDYNVALGIINEGSIGPTEASSFLLPRINIQVTPSGGTMIYAGYGMFAQMPALNPLYYSSYYLSRRIAAEDRSPYGGDIAFAVRPERSRQFEIAIEHVISPLLTARIATYNKTLSNQVQVSAFYDTQGNRLFTQYRNDGTGLAKGLEIECDFSFAPSVTAHLGYEYAIARGLSSFPRSNRVLFSDETFPPTPLTLRPFDYQQSHRATVVLHARTADDDLFLGGIEATAVLTARSGHAYTRHSEIRNLGSSNPWSIGVYTILDPRFAYPVEAHNASTTPFTTNLDLRFAKTFDLRVAALTFFVQVLNVFNTKNVVNVYPTTGAPNDDSWLNSQFSDYSRQFPDYDSFYRDINLKNRWAYMGAAGNDIYGTPRSIQFGVNVKLGGSQ